MLKKFKKELLIRSSFSDIKSMYDFLNLHLSNMETEAKEKAFSLNDNEEYIKLKKGREMMYQVMQKRANEYF